MVRHLFLSAVICAYVSKGFAQAPPDSTEVVQTMNNFLDAFTNLKWEQFAACWDEDATAFFPPSARIPYRANNKQEVLNIFQHVFENARRQKSSPPYLIIQPLDMKIQMAGTVAVVTFTLTDPDLFGRRTLILKKEAGKWLIIHLHASGVAIQKSAALN